uniref:Uncharacterized protein n=1 Tax=Anguilla anguilla TaxID=7936 RepID=A0A0E9RLV8_ANGAN
MNTWEETTGSKAAGLSMTSSCNCTDQIPFHLVEYRMQDPQR